MELRKLMGNALIPTPEHPMGNALVSKVFATFMVSEGLYGTGVDKSALLSKPKRNHRPIVLDNQ